MSLLSRLENVRDRGNGQFIAKCPAHSDQSPSLSVRVKPNGMVLIHCFAGCTPLSVLEAVDLDLDDLFPERVEARPSRTGWDYKTMLQVLHRETLIVSTIASDMLHGKKIAPADFERLKDALKKINGVKDATNA